MDNSSFSLLVNQREDSRQIAKEAVEEEYKRKKKNKSKSNDDDYVDDSGDEDGDTPTKEKLTGKYYAERRRRAKAKEAGEKYEPSTTYRDRASERRTGTVNEDVLGGDVKLPGGIEDVTASMTEYLGGEER